MINFGSNQIFLLIKNGNTYEIKYFYNDELLLNINYDEFKNRILDLMKKNEKDLVYFCQGFQKKDYTIIILFSTIIALFIANVSVCLYHRTTLCERKKYISIEPTGKSIEIRNEV